LCTRVKSPNDNDWLKLKRLLGFLKSTEQDELTIEASNYGKITWHLDAAFGVHNDYKSHTGAIMTLGLISLAEYNVLYYFSLIFKLQLIILADCLENPNDLAMTPERRTPAPFRYLNLPSRLGFVVLF
jgi:hypothetical protein